MNFQKSGHCFDPLQNIGNVFWDTFRNSKPEITKGESASAAEITNNLRYLYTNVRRLFHNLKQITGVNYAAVFVS
jgi:hypothetical protein